MDSEKKDGAGEEKAGKVGEFANKKTSAGFLGLRFTEFDSGGLSEQTE